MKTLRIQMGLWLALLVCNIMFLISPDWFWLRFPAALALAFILPGWAWGSALQWLQTDDIVERIVLVFGCASVISAIFLLVALLLPGPFTETPNLIALNLGTLTGLLWQLVRSVKNQLLIPNYQPLKYPARTILLILVAIIAVAAFTRLTRLDYSEFHEDELENMRLIVRAYKGEEYAPFLDSKGPIHWLLPGALWYLNGWINEGIARTPFVMASILLVPLMYSLGRRISGGRDSVGLIAAGLVGLNGFFVALSRHVENRALIVFWGVLAVWFIYRYYKDNLPQHFLYAMLTLGIGLIAHPNVLLYLPVVGYILWLKIRQERAAWWRQWPWLLAAGLIFAGLIGLFYIPYLTDPEIGLVYQYFAQERVGESLLYNEVGNIFVEDALYSTWYHAPLLVLLLIWLLVRYFARWRWAGRLLLAVLVVAIASSIFWPEGWIIDGINLAFVPAAILGLAFMLLPNQTSQVYADPEIKIIWLWFLLPLGALVFLAKDASNHIQVAYPGWALLAAFAMVDLWRYLSTANQLRLGLKTRFGAITIYQLLKTGLSFYLALAIPLIVFYQYLSFDDTVTAYWQAKRAAEFNPNSVYNWLYGGIPRPRRAISNPRLGGWKAVGYLWQQGTLSGDFRSINESFAVPVWYTFQTPRSCYDDPQHYWLRNDWKGWPEEEQPLKAQGYTLTRIVLVDQQPMLRLYEKNAAPREPELFDSEIYRPLFDRLVTPARMAQAEAISHPSAYNFGDKLLLQGYNLTTRVAHPGDLIPVTVFWKASSPMDIRYRGFVHLVGADGQRWGQHDDDPACRLLTSEMRPGQESSRQFRLPVDPATPPGEYQIVFGLYDPTTQARLPIWDNLANQSPGDSLLLGRVTIE